MIELVLLQDIYHEVIYLEMLRYGKQVSGFLQYLLMLGFTHINIERANYYLTSVN